MMFKSNPLSLLAPALMLAASMHPFSAEAASFTPGGDEKLGCFLSISGVIEPGDGQKLEQALNDVIGDPYAGDSNFLQRWDNVDGLSVPRICLDSPGGSLTAALEMADVLIGDNYLYSSIGTAVPAGATCHSACAVFFMAGGYQSEGPGGRLPNRVLHAQGSLGFHSPGLSIPDGNYSQDVVDKAFTLAVDSIRLLTERQAKMRFPETLLNVLVSTPPNDMYILSTVGEASQWMIDVAGLPWPETPVEGHFVNACMNARPTIVPASGYFESFTSSHRNNYDARIQTYPLGLMTGYDSHMAHQPGGALTMDRDGQFASAEFISDPEPEEGALNCTATLQGLWPIRTPDVTNYRSLFIGFARGGEMAAGRAALLPPWASFAVLNDTYGETALPADAVVWSHTRTATTRCVTFDQSERRTDLQTCEAVETAETNHTGVTRMMIRFTWPSGASTVITSDGLFENTVNGNKARGKYISDGLPETGNEYSCLENSGSGNTFCYEQVILE